MNIDINDFLPPILTKTYRSIKKRIARSPTFEQMLQDQVLFNGDDSLFKTVLSETRKYGEYGCGQSTIWVARNSSCTIQSVDTSLEWVNKVSELALLKTPERRLMHVDLGEVGPWGMPESFARRNLIWDYLASPWKDSSYTPDTVLIDGRFRMACFLYSLLNAPKGTRIIFDDYVGREPFRVAEEFLNLSSQCGRQALFVVDVVQDRDFVENELNRFLYVRE